jgi:hypothetical protein
MKREFTVVDMSGYVDGRSSNGGGYSFTTYYREMEDGRFEVSYDTSASFPFNPATGEFGNSIDDEEYEIISEEETKECIRKALADARAGEYLECYLKVGNTTVAFHSLS